MLFLMQQSLHQQESQKTTVLTKMVFMCIISGLKGKTYLQKCTIRLFYSTLFICWNDLCCVAL